MTAFEVRLSTQDVRETLEAIRAEIVDLLSQRDELLESLRGVLLEADRETVAFQRARAAIAKAEGGAS